MAIAFNAAPVATGGAASGTSLTWSHTCTGTNLILWSGLLIARASTGTAPTSATYNGVAMTILPDTVFAVGSGDLYLAYLVGPATGANNIVWNFSGTGNLGTTGFSTSYTGAAQTGVPDSKNTSTAASGSSFSTATTVVASNCWLVCVVANDTAQGFISAPAIVRVDNGSQLFADSNGTVGTGSQSITSTIASGSAHWGAIIASFAPAGAAATTVSYRALLGVGI